jgi:tripartite-type tricarboxylate transporter receptor subunit TctC
MSGPVKPNRRQALASTFILLCMTSLGAHAQSFPDKPLRLTTGFPPGTAPDLLARILGQRLGELLKQPVVVDNKPGAGAQIATQSVARSAADGYSLLLAEAGSLSIAPAAFSKLPYDANRDLTAVAEVAWADFVLVVPQDSLYASLGALVQNNKGKNEPLNFATFGAGTPGHFLASELAEEAGVKVEPIHYRSTGDALTGILSGSVVGGWVSTAVAVGQIKAGKMRGLAITARDRSPLLPDVPTVAESRLPKLSHSSFLAIMAPAGTPRDTLDLLNARIVESLQTPEVRKKLVEIGLTVTGKPRAESDSMLVAEAARWGAIVKRAGFKGD